MADRQHGMTSRQPARQWQDAFPTGNGSIGAMIYGHIRNELILLNHDRLWLRREKPELPDVSDHLAELRAMIAEGRYQEALTFMHERLVEHGYPGRRVDPYLPAFDLKIDQETVGAFTKYRRHLDFATGEASVSWQDERASFQRKTFVSRADDVVVTDFLSSEKGAISAQLTLAPHGLGARHHMGAWEKEDPAQVPIMFEASAEVDTDGVGWLRLRGAFDPDRSGDDLIATEFGGVACVVTQGGAMRQQEESIVVQGADRVTVLVALYANEPKQAAEKRFAAKLSGLPESYEDLLARHIQQHQALFERVSLDLHAGGERSLSNEQLLLDGYDGDVPTALIERMADYGRYLLICSSAPGGMPANLQGLWNGDYAPPWESDYHNDENIQMCYWAALPANLAEAALPYFDYYDASTPDYQENAQKVYGCRGILAPISQSTHGLMHYGPWVNWTAGAGWLAQLYYDQWLFTGDESFLRQRAVPFMRQVALFYEDFLIEGPGGKLLVTPSLSPENRPAILGSSLVTVNATMDIAIAKELLSNLCAACRVLGIEEEGVARWEKLLAKLPDYQINADGAIKEWIHPDLLDNYHHRHQSHIYPLFPGLEVTEETDPVLYEACRVAVEKRLVVGLTSQSGWSLAHMASIYARLGQGDRALACLELLTRACVGPNLFTYHNDWRGQGLTLGHGPGTDPIFQIDANMGLTAAVIEMLLFSKPGLIKLLPALPSAWAKGQVTGLRGRGGITASIEWDMEKRELHAELRADREQTVTVKFPSAVKHLESSRLSALVDSPLGAAYRQITLDDRQAMSITALLE